MKYADIIIPYGRQNNIAVEFVVENIKTRLKKMGIRPNEPYPLSPYLQVRGKPLSLIGEPDETNKDIYEIVNNLLLNKEPFQKKSWLGFISQKLIKQAAKSEKFAKIKFGLAKSGKTVENLDLVILFEYAILNENTVEKINKQITELFQKKAKRICIFSFYLNPDLGKKINLSSGKIELNSLICNDKIDDIKETILNTDGKLSTPTEKEYYEAFTEELSLFD